MIANAPARARRRGGGGRAGAAAARPAGSLPRCARWSATTSAGSTPTATPPSCAGGKSVRAALALLSARAAGADADADGMPGAVAVELVHTFSLLHDDIMDGDAERHHRPAGVGGVRPGAGDPGRRRRARARLPGAARCRLAASRRRARVAGGRDRAADRRPGGRPRPRGPGRRRRPSSARRCAPGKTGALLECAASIGAVLAGAAAEVVEPLRAFGAPPRAGVPGRRRPARDLGRPGRDRQAGVRRPRAAQDLAARGDRAPVRRRGGAAELAGAARPARISTPAELAAAAGLVECVRRPGRRRRAGRAEQLGMALAALDGGADRCRGPRRHGRDRPLRRGARRSTRLRPFAGHPEQARRALADPPHHAGERRGRSRERSGPNTSRPASRSPATSSRASTGRGLRTRRCSTSRPSAGRLVDAARGCRRGRPRARCRRGGWRSTAATAAARPRRSRSA